ncbi:MAG TPA: hypothetical protein VME17_14530 [Bryobacteraceae bacterium]|nr:hypothetical protein [Bryobacteraceae bacterium]
MPTRKLTTELIVAAIQGFESQKQRIDLEIAQLKAMLSGSVAKRAATTEPLKRKRRRMSAAARAKIAEAQRARWQAFHERQVSEAPTKKSAPKQKVSAAAKAKPVANLKKASAAKAAKKAAA